MSHSTVHRASCTSALVAVAEVLFLACWISHGHPMELRIQNACAASSTCPLSKASLLSRSCQSHSASVSHRRGTARCTGIWVLAHFPYLALGGGTYRPCVFPGVFSNAQPCPRAWSGSSPRFIIFYTVSLVYLNIALLSDSGACRKHRDWHQILPDSIER